MRLLEDGHGTALDRVSAVQKGFSAGPGACAAITMEDITRRRGDLPMVLQADPNGALQSGQVPITEDTLNTLMEILTKIFDPQQPPTLSLDGSHLGCSHRLGRGWPRRGTAHRLTPLSLISVHCRASGLPPTSPSTFYCKATTLPCRW